MLSVVKWLSNPFKYKYSFYPPEGLIIIRKSLLGLARLQEKYPVLILLLILTTSLFLGYYALRVETDSSFDTMYTEDSESLTLSNLISNEFGSTDNVFILITIDESANDKDRIQDIRHPDVLKAMNTLTESLELETTVDSAISMVTIFNYGYGRLPTTLAESKEMIANLPAEIKETYLSNLLSSDYHAANMLVQINVENKAGSLERIEENLRDKIAGTPFPIGVKAELTGMPILFNVIMEYLINDNVRTIGLAILGVFIILWIYFRSWKIALFSTTPVILTLVWLSGTLYLMNVRITVMIASIGAMMVGMSVDYAIHLTHTFHEKVKQGHAKPVEKTVTDVGSALLASVLTTMAGFLAMLLGVTPGTTTQGKVLSIGIAYAFIITMLALPPLMILQRKFIYSKLDEVVFRIKG